MKIFLSPELLAAKIGISLPPDKSRHLATVMRAEKGDNISLIDGCGKTYRAVISDINRKNVIVDVLEETPSQPESAAKLILCQGILKGEKMDFIIQKATELGVSEIMPIISERCQVRQTRKSARWRKIAEEASEQCGRSVVPVVHEEISFDIFLKRLKTGGIIFWECGGLRIDRALGRLKSSDVSIHICVGPEGGFPLSEVEAGEAAGLVRTTLGDTILKAETAAIAGVALVRYEAEKGLNDAM
jgi:16S rRNA (uracil1498-N3)-methyltransferase